MATIDERIDAKETLPVGAVPNYVTDAYLDEAITITLQKANSVPEESTGI